MIHPMNEPLPDTLVLLCRPGFERDCSAEIIDSLARTGVAAWCRAEAGAGLVEVRSGEGWDARRALAEIRFDALVFARDWLAGRMLDDLPVGDRITPLLAAARALGPFADCWLQHVDTGEGRSVGKLCARLQARVQGALAGEGLLARRAAMRLQVLFLSGSRAFVGVAPVANGARWSMGIPRLRLPGAPSRSAAKLEEGLLWFLGDEADRLLRSGMSAVDLGAAPGGWTWILARRGLAVTAVDRGALSPQAQHAGAVRHLAEDAFPFRPAHPVDWLVCDIVDKPARVAELIERWFLNGWCRQAIFNLKLPMKQRYRDAAVMLARIVAELETGGARYACTARQLYHDREEITVWLRRI
jgi:23S rRNA (cytidine2498-2'-O)-methyltransferase